MPVGFSFIVIIMNEFINFGCDVHVYVLYTMQLNPLVKNLNVPRSNVAY